MSILGIVDSVLDIFKRPLRNRFDPVRRMERDMEKLEKRRKKIKRETDTDRNRTLVADIDVELCRLHQQRDRELIRNQK